MIMQNSLAFIKEQLDSNFFFFLGGWNKLSLPARMAKVFFINIFREDT